MSLMSTYTYRQKTLTVELLANVVILAGFLVYLALYRGPHNFAPLFVVVGWYFPIFYSVLKIHTTEDTRTDERARDFENRGRRDGYGFLSFGVFALLYQRSGSGVSLLHLLLIVWILSQMVVNGKQLRLYAGHESWLPDFFVPSRRKRRLAARAALVHLDPRDEDGKQ